MTGDNQTTDRQTADRQEFEDDKLQRFHDDELNDAERMIMIRELSDSPEEQARLAEIERLGDMLRMASADLEIPSGADALFDKIQTGIDNEPVPRLRVIKSERKRHTGYIVGAIALAAAAALFFMLNPPSENVATNDTDDVVVPEVHIEDQPPVQIHASAGSEVEEVDFGANTGTVFEVEGSSGQPLAVVWIVESEEEVL